jgi:hypothetical protein
MTMRSESNQVDTSGDTGWRGFYPLGAITAFVTVLVMLSEIAITFLPGGGRVAPENVTVVDWFELFQRSWFLGLRNLGLINILAASLMIPASLAVFGALKRQHEPWAALGLVLSLIGAGVYLAGNTGFAMLNLSARYWAATTAAERAAIEAAGRAMLALGESHTPGTFLAFLFLSGGGILLSALMWRSASFGRGTAIAGVLGNSLLVIFEIISDFVPPLFDASLAIAAAGGLLAMAWYVLVGRDLLRIARKPTGP